MSTKTKNHQFIKLELTDPADITMINTNWDTIDEELTELEEQIKISGTTIVSATSTDGVAYTAAVDGISELSVGLSLYLVPDKTTASTAPTLNLNGLGAKTIRRKLSMGTASTSIGNTNAWLFTGKPTLLVYNGANWIASELTQPCANDLYGTVPVDHGGTGATTAVEALANLGIIISATEPENPTENMIWIKVEGA